MKKSGMKGLAVATCVSAAIVAALTGCGAKPATKDIKAVAGNAAVGSVLLSINPEIELEYNKAGLITRSRRRTTTDARGWPIPRSTRAAP